MRGFTGLTSKFTSDTFLQISFWAGYFNFLSVVSLLCNCEISTFFVLSWLLEEGSSLTLDLELASGPQIGPVLASAVRTV